MDPQIDSVQFLMRDGMPHRAVDICSGLNISMDELEEIMNHLNHIEYTLIISVDHRGDLTYQKAGGFLPWQVKDPEALRKENVIRVNFLETNTIEG